MKSVSDLIQIALSLPAALGYIACVILVVLCFFLFRSATVAVTLTFKAAAMVWKRVLRLRIMGVITALLIAVPVFMLRWKIIDGLQYLEQVAMPTYVSSDTSTHALAVYEAELSKHCDSYEAEIVKRRTREIAAKIGCSPLAIYEVAYSECGMNPFCIRADGIAAGWIQFTSAGMAGIGTLDDVKRACKSRDVSKIMDYTEAYFSSRAGGKALHDATQVYVATFAPAYVGSGDQQVLYSGWKNPAYNLNSVFDGYYSATAGDGRRQIFRRRSEMDGKITIGEMRLHLEAKKSALLKN